MATTFSVGASTKISQNIRKSCFSLQNGLLSKFNVEIYNQHLRIDPYAKFQLNQTKIRTTTENAQILGLLMAQFEYDVMLTSPIVVSNSILLFIR